MQKKSAEDISFRPELPRTAPRHQVHYPTDPNPVARRMMKLYLANTYVEEAPDLSYGYVHLGYIEILYQYIYLCLFNPDVYVLNPTHSPTYPPFHSPTHADKIALSRFHTIATVTTTPTTTPTTMIMAPLPNIHTRARARTQAYEHNHVDNH